MWLKWGRLDGNLRDLIYRLSWREEIRSHSASHPEVNLLTGTCWKSWLRLGPHSLHIHAELYLVFRLVLLLYLVWCCWGALVHQESWQRFQCCRVCRWIYRLVYQKDLLWSSHDHDSVSERNLKNLLQWTQCRLLSIIFRRVLLSQILQVHPCSLTLTTIFMNILSIHKYQHVQALAQISYHAVLEVKDIIISWIKPRKKRLLQRKKDNCTWNIMRYTLPGEQRDAPWSRVGVGVRIQWRTGRGDAWPRPHPRTAS